MYYNMDNLTILYKITKYVSKSKKYGLFKSINTRNIKLIYKLAKDNYLQKGGARLSDAKLENTKVSHLSFHGSIKAFSTLTVPDNMHLVIPLCCGFSNIDSQLQFDFFNKTDHEIKNIINNAENIIKIGQYNYFILNPNDTYCDINIQISFDPTISEGILSTMQKKDHIENLTIDTKLNDEIKLKLNKTHNINEDDINILLLVLKNDLKEEDLQINDDDMVPFICAKQFSKFIYRENWNNLVLNIFKKQIFSIMTHNFRKHFEEEMEDIYNMCDESDVADFRNTMHTLSEMYEINNIGYVKLSVKFIVDILEKIYKNAYKKRDEKVINEIQYYEIIEKYKKLVDKHYRIININSIVVEIMEDIMSSNEKTLEFIRSINTTHFNFLDDDDFKELDANRVYCYSLRYDDIVFIIELYTILVEITYISPLHRDFLKYIFSDKEEHVKLKLSDLLKFIREKQDGDLFIFNNSCQPFNNEISICHAGKCLYSISKKIGHELLSDRVFDNSYFEDIINALTYINDIDNTYFKPPDTADKYKSCQFIDNVLIEESIAEGHDIRDDFKNYRIMIIAYVNFLYDKFPKLFEILAINTELYIKNDADFSAREYGALARLLVVVLNIFITEFYNKTTVIHQDKIKSIMGELE